MWLWWQAFGLQHFNALHGRHLFQEVKKIGGNDGGWPIRQGKSLQMPEADVVVARASSFGR